MAGTPRTRSATTDAWAWSTQAQVVLGAAPGGLYRQICTSRGFPLRNEIAQRSAYSPRELYLFSFFFRLLPRGVTHVLNVVTLISASLVDS